MKASRVFAAVIALVMLLTFTPIPSYAEVHNTAHLQAFIQNDPLQGDNGLDTNHLAPLIYGPINIGFDMDGNALEAVDQQDLFYANGYYYLIGKSFMEGTFAYAPGVPHNETLNTTPATFYRWGGLVTYRSEDLENWEFVNRLYVQEEGTGRHIVMYKPRMCYSAATGKYVLWVLHKTDSSDPEAPILVMTADSPEGPWSDPQPPTMPEGMAYSDLTHDYQIKVDPNTGIGWYTQAGAETRLYRMTPEMTGVEKDFSFKVKQLEEGTGENFGSFGTNPLAGGMGLFYREGWWYIFAAPQCGNCVGTQISYVMAMPLVTTASL